MTDARDTAKPIKPNIEILEERRLLSSALLITACAAAPSADVKTVSALSIAPASISSGLASTNQPALSAAPAQASLAEAMALKAAMSQVASAEALSLTAGDQTVSYPQGARSDVHGAHGGYIHNDYDGDDAAYHAQPIGGHGFNRELTSIHGQFTVITPGDPTAAPPVAPAYPNAPQEPAQTGATTPTQPSSSTSQSQSARAFSRTGSTVSATATTLLTAPKSTRVLGGSARQDAARVVDSLAASASKPAAALGQLATAAEASGRAGGTFAALFSRTSIGYEQVVAAATKVARVASAVTAEALPAMARTLETAVESPQKFFRFERMSDPMLLIGDAYAAFAEESSLLGTAQQVNPYAKAWSITGSVVAFDTAALVYWIHTRKRRRAARAGSWSFDIAGGEIE